MENSRICFICGIPNVSNFVEQFAVVQSETPSEKRIQQLQEDALWHRYNDVFAILSGRQLQSGVRNRCHDSLLHLHTHKHTLRLLTITLAVTQ
jgi:hypothetical protein